jgi:hypothetical protein
LLISKVPEKDIPFNPENAITLNLLLTAFALFVPAPVQFLRARKERSFCEAFRQGIHRVSKKDADDSARPVPII